MSSAIMRFQKAHNNTEIGHIISHNTRSKEVKNADKDREHLNEVVNYVEDIKEHIKVLEKAHKQACGQKVRKDAVRVLEVIMTSDKEFFNRVNDSEYFEECRKWLIDIFGAENILQMAIHRDERTPHAHFIVTPIVENQFACKRIINGRNAVRGLQNSFHNSVKHLGLDRGKIIEYTGAKHKTSLQFADDVQKAKERVSEMSKTEIESYAAHAEILKEQNANLMEQFEYYANENDRLREEISIVQNKYDNLKEGLIDMAKLSAKDADIQIRALETKGQAIRQEKAKKRTKMLSNDNLEL